MIRGLVAVGWAMLLAFRYLKALKVCRSESGVYFRKSLNLALCYLGFRSNASLRQAAAAGRAAFLCCAYDVVTDWRGFSPEMLNVFRVALRRHAAPDLAEMALSLYLRERDGCLEEDGLERGSVAFVFVTRMMGSESYFIERTDIQRLGIILQLVDDILDYESDLRTGDLNCLNSPRCNDYLLMAVQELSESLTDVFFQKEVVLGRVIELARCKAQDLLVGRTSHERGGLPNLSRYAGSGL